MTARQESAPWIRCARAGLATLGLLACSGSGAPPPNVLLILADDLGYGELGAYGRSDGHTPSLDRLAAEGARFTRHYATASCAPARAALLTGLHPARLGFRPRGRGLPTEVTTLPELLRERGYTSRHLGKWHLGGTGIWGLDASPASGLPSAHGFDHWFGFLDSWLLRGRDEAVPEPRLAPRYRAGTYLNPWLLGSDAPAARYGGHLTDLLTDRAVDFIRAGDDSPWLLNLWYLAPHAPQQPHPRFAERHPNTPAGRRRALVQQLDESVGRLMRALEETDQARRTLVVFLSDNGAGLLDDPTANAPLRGRKTELEEGGLRTPLLMRLPDRIETGGVVEAPVSILDVLPTIAAFAGADVAGVDGRDLSPLLAGRDLPPRPLFWEQASPEGDVVFSALSGNGALRWIGGLGSTRWLDLAADPSGGTAIEAAQAEGASDLEQAFRGWRREALRVPVRIAGRDPRGHALAKGSNPLRAPGWGGFTFGIGVTPDARATRPQRDEVIALQPDLWELVRSPRNALRLRLGEVELKGRKLREGACNAVVVTGHFSVSAHHPELNRGRLTLFLDGLEQSSADEIPLPTAHDLSAATHLGRGSRNRDALRGSLSVPIFLSARVVARGGGAEGTASVLSDELCPPQG